MTTEQTTCKQCGTCCKQGGPALHSQDLDLIRSGRIPVSSLITIRKGELVHNPLAKRIQPVSVELVKLVGKKRQWECCFYDDTQGCTVYKDRPYACRVLKCWDIGEISALMEKDTLSRFDILDKDDPLITLIREHERICPCDDLGYLQSHLSHLSGEQKNELERRVQSDLKFRARVTVDFQLKVSEELFYFGRPLFQLLQPLGVNLTESSSGFRLIWGK
ncbi:YkgJ family cysteine cluster protein [Desulfopila sp. IMCC35006]|uniref:YkgJ family cysteine cluster protein n=1 Tax=Desulfopila sp. IMCC35006 TaxID=2569542 RepID=UPI0010AC81EE|nr:YkgJ family cysteine cluster protein [Desulfopila sp. IMCC35006]TKB28084.1 YkgJ family cysteine cluster protein [Desulfopila sp. IMCC35006]